MVLREENQAYAELRLLLEVCGVVLKKSGNQDGGKMKAGERQSNCGNGAVRSDYTKYKDIV